MSDKGSNISWREWLGLKPLAVLKERRNLGGFLGFLLSFFGLVYLCLLGFALIAAFAVILSAISPPPAETQPPNLGAGALITALLSAPFVIWRTLVAQWTVDKERDSLWNEKFNAASEGLSATLEVRRLEKIDDKESWVTVKEPDLTTRTIAIDKLVSLTKQKPDETSRTIEILAAYMRGNCPAPNKHLTSEIGRKKFSRLAEGRKAISPHYLTVLRHINFFSDIQKNSSNQQLVDLSDTDLSGMNFEGADLTYYHLSRSYMDRCDLTHTHLPSTMEQVSFVGCEIGSLENKTFIDCDFRLATIGRVFVFQKNTTSQIVNCAFEDCKFDFSHFSEVEFKECKFGYLKVRGAKITRTSLTDCRGSFLYLVACDVRDIKATDRFNSTQITSKGSFFRETNISELEENSTLDCYFKNFGDSSNIINSDINQWVISTKELTPGGLMSPVGGEVWQEYLDWLKDYSPENTIYLDEHPQT